MCKSGIKPLLDDVASLICIIYYGNLTKITHMGTLRGVYRQIYFSNQPPHESDWIINYSINASLHLVRWCASKYLPMQNNLRRLDYHFKLLAHNQDGGKRAIREPQGGEKKVLCLRLISMHNHKHNTHLRAGEACVLSREGWVQKATKHHSLVDMEKKKLGIKLENVY